MRCVLICTAVLCGLFPACAGEAAAAREWLVPAPLNYATWAQEIDYDFPDGDVDGKLAKMARIGMTTYFFERGTEEFRSKLFAAAKKHGIKLYLRTFGLRTLSHKEAAEQPERLFQVPWAKNRRYGCPSWPSNLMRYLPGIERFLRSNREHLTGINVDFIRYPDDDPCNCPACTKLNQQYLGRRELKQEALNDRGLREKYAQMRCSVVREALRKARGMCDRLGLKLSVSVFINPPRARLLGQDWVGWAREGIADFVCPMNYTHDRARPASGYARMSSQSGMARSCGRPWPAPGPRARTRPRRCWGKAST